MASEVSLCNVALGLCSNEANIASLVEGSVEAQLCAQFYPLARDELLAAYNWNFCTKRVALATITNLWSGWQYCYAKPNDCLSAICVLLPNATDDTQTQDYIQELTTDAQGNDVQAIYTNVQSAVLKYTKMIVDPTKFSSLFNSTLPFLLAGYLAGPLTKDQSLQKAMFAEAERRVIAAKSQDGMDQNNNAYGDKHAPGFLGRNLSNADTRTDFNGNSVVGSSW